MGERAVSRRLAITGGLCAGGALVVAAAEHGVHTSGGRRPTPSAAPSSPVPSAATGSGSGSGTPSDGVSPSPTTSEVRTHDQLIAKLDAYGRARGSTFAVALRDVHTDRTFRYHATWRNQMFSTVKVLIVATVLRNCQERGTPLTPTQVAATHAAITRSDNDAASALLASVGLADLQWVARRYGLTSTVIRGGTEPGRADWWGYSTTTADDLLALLRGALRGTPVLTSANRDYLKSLMSQVIPAQRWGVCAPPLPASVTWQTKNGWGRRDDGYHTNSIGHISGNGRDYDAVIMCRSPHKPAYTAERQYSYDTASGVSRILYDALAHRVG